MSGRLAMTSLEPEMMEVVHSAARRLRGLTLCQDGREEGAVTHLIIGLERRTIKVRIARVLEPLCYADAARLSVILD